ncbi:MAG: 3-deoxy-manno-octulosonate cytidylyltransferase [Acidobacteria bacterium]|nr:3-deoxy-manno-octulosonate cytidylyltransferase [Acidobacteriota bacterium]
MEQHGSNPRQNVIAIIPARFASTRLPGKLLLDVCGKPLILHTLERAAAAGTVARVIVATDDDRIFKVVTESGAEAMMTSPDHQSGSDRIAEVAAKLPEGSIIVNVQGDEPLISPETIDRAVEILIGDPDADVATICEAIETATDVFSPDIVKVVANESGDAIYFSRSPIPFLRDEVNRAGGLAFALKDDPGLLRHFKKHTGLYVYRREFLLRYAKMPPSRLERAEMLEQLRILENGGKIKIVEVAASSIGVDTTKDLEYVKQILGGGSGD